MEATPAPCRFTGLDLHKRSITATTIDRCGGKVAHQKLPCHPAALALYFADQPGPHLAAVECTSGWYWVKDALAQIEVELKLAHAKGVKAITAAKVKTDAADALMLAQLLRLDMLPEAHMISDELRPLRDVLRTRLTLVQRHTAATNSIGRLLEKMNLEAIDDLPDGMRLAANCHLAQSELLAEQIKQLEKALHPHLVPDADVQRLMRMPGIQKICAFTIKLEVGDISRFPTDKQFFSYCRLVPGADNSAGRIRHKRSREGNRYLKIAFSHAAIRAIQYYPEVREWYKGKARRKGKAIARTLVAKELARIVYHILTKQEDFNGRFKGRPLSRTKQEQWPLLPSPDA